MAAPDPVLAPAEFGELARTQRRLFRGKELVELRRLDARELSIAWAWPR